MRLLLVGHELTFTGAPLVLLELADALRKRGHNISFLFLRGGPLESQVQAVGFPYSIVPEEDENERPSAGISGGGWAQRTAYPALWDPRRYDAVLANTAVVHPWLRCQVEAWGLAFMRRVVWWIHELPRGPTLPLFTDGITLQRHLMARAAAVLFDSDASRAWWEAWVLQEAYWIGLDYSPFVGRQESMESTPPLPSALPSFRTLRLGVPDWLAQQLPPSADGSSSKAGSGTAELRTGGGSLWADGVAQQQRRRCAKGAEAWPHLELRQQFRQRINATDADYVVLFVGANVGHKGTAELVAAFARAWRRQLDAGTPGRMLLVCVGPDMPLLRPAVEEQELHQQKQLEQQQQERQGSRQQQEAQLDGQRKLSSVVHLFDAAEDGAQRLGWYAAADAQVVNSECENFGRVTLEGMALSLPLLATACGGTLELVAAGATGLLHPPPSAGEPSVEALAANLLRLDPRSSGGRQLAAALGEAGCLRAATDFSPTAFLVGMEAQVAAAAAAADAADAVAEQAARGRQLAAGSGSSLEEAAALPSVWAASFMSDPRMQAQVRHVDYRWEWRELPPAPTVAFESLVIPAGSMQYNLGGYSGTNDIVLGATMRTVELKGGRPVWQELQDVQVPAGLTETHAAVEVVADHHAYFVSGQKGPACSPAVNSSFRLDLRTRRFSSMLPSPEPRYAANLVLMRGRLHFFGGLLPDRKTPARDHWSVALAPDGGAEGGWRVEAPLPPGLGGSHMTRALLWPRGAADPALYVWSSCSQEYAPTNASAGNYECATDREWCNAGMWSLSPSRGWRRHADMPSPLTHNQQCSLRIGTDSVLIVGGAYFDRWLSRTIWLFNATDETWTRVGQMPIYNKGHICILQGDKLLLATGQAGQDDGHNPIFGPLSDRQFLATVPPELVTAAREEPPADMEARFTKAAAAAGELPADI